MSRLLVGNLDCEVTFAGAAGRRLPERVLTKISRAALALEVLAAPGDRLWTPRPVSRARRDVELVSGLLSEQAPAEAVLAWGETDEVAALRRSCEGPARPGGERDLAGALWALHPTPAIAQACNDRALSFALAQERGWALGGARWLRSVRELEEHLARGGAEGGAQSAWVLKAPLAAAGRERIRRRGAELEPEVRTRAERLFGRFGRLLFEPWVERVGDFGCTGVIGPGGVRLLPPHRQQVDSAGVVRAIEIEAHRAHLAPMTRAAEAAGEALAERGYRGPFGVDGFLYRDPSGEIGWQPLSEINARLSFGLLAHAAAERRGVARHRLTI